MKYSYKNVLDSYPKNHIESLWTRFIVRPLSFPIAWFMVNIGCTAWFASILSIFVAISACACFCFNNQILRITGIVLIVLWQLLDCVDGTIARTTKKTSSMGEFIDAQSGYTIMGLIFVCVGLSAYYTTNYFSHEYSYWLIFIGGISSITNVLARLINSKYNYCSFVKTYKDKGMIEIEDVNEKPTSKFGRIRVFFDFHIGLVGLFVPLLIVSEIFKIYDFITIFYCLYALAGFVVSSALYAYKAK